jgi:poly-gamma-glutamate synthesis protein (capsule biosynthesis protein)
LQNLLNNFRIAFSILLASVFFPYTTADAAGLTSPFEAEAARAITTYSALPSAASAPNTPDSSGKNRYLGGVTPHHDVALAMIVRFYERIASPEAKRVWLFSPDHFHRARKPAAFCDGDWALASGTLKADKEACEALRKLKIAEANHSWFGAEHGITLHVPLIAHYFPNAAVVPMVLNPRIPDLGLLILRNKILELMRDDDIVILSMDLSHYKTPEGMAAEDEKTLLALENLASGATGRLDVDARRAASLVLRLLQDRGATRGVVLEHTDSSALLGRRIESGTSYATIIYRQ